METPGLCTQIPPSLRGPAISTARNAPAGDRRRSSLRRLGVETAGGEVKITAGAHDDLYKAFTSTGLEPPPGIADVPRTIFDKPKKRRHYDQIAWFNDAAQSGFPGTHRLYRVLGPMSCRCVQKSATANSPTRRTHSQRPVVAAKDRRAQGAVVANGVSGLQAGNAISGKRSRSRRGGAAGRTTSLGAALASNALPRCRASSARRLRSPAGTDPRRGDRASASY